MYDQEYIPTDTEQEILENAYINISESLDKIEESGDYERVIYTLNTYINLFEERKKEMMELKKMRKNVQ